MRIVEGMDSMPPEPRNHIAEWSTSPKSYHTSLNVLGRINVLDWLIVCECLDNWDYLIILGCFNVLDCHNVHICCFNWGLWIPQCLRPPHCLWEATSMYLNIWDCIIVWLGPSRSSKSKVKVWAKGWTLKWVYTPPTTTTTHHHHKL